MDRIGADAALVESCVFARLHVFCDWGRYDENRITTLAVVTAHLIYSRYKYI